MNVKIFTLPFDKETMDFKTQELDDFCANKRVVAQKSQFFEIDNRPYWTVSVEYEDVVIYDRIEESLDKTQNELMARLKIWRKEKASSAGIPPYIIATNKQLADIVLKKVTTKVRLADIKGFGTKKTANYGTEITQMVTKFYKNDKKY